MKHILAAAGMLLIGCEGARSNREAIDPRATVACGAASPWPFPDSVLEHSSTARRHLLALGEPGLCPGADSILETYRFLWLRSFHVPVVVRVDRLRSGQYELRVAAEGYGRTTVSFGATRRLTPVDWLRLTQAIDRLHFWTRLGRYPPKAMMDGAGWILEGVRDGRYRALYVGSPAEDGPEGALRTAALSLLSLAPLPDSIKQPIY